MLIAGGGVLMARFGINKTGAGGKPRPPLLNVRTGGMREGELRSHLKSRRCVIPCEGFYEWRDEGGKQPYGCWVQIGRVGSVGLGRGRGPFIDFIPTFGLIT
jgi:hypothetical protein